MKKLWLLLLLLVVGCAKEDVVQHSQSNVDANYQALRNGMSIMSKMDVSETAILAFPPANIPTEKGDVYIPSYVQDNQVISMDTSISSSCSLDHPDACDNAMTMDKIPYYYHQQLYYIGQAYDTTSDSYKDAIFRSALDGTQQKLLYTFEKNETNPDGWNSSFLQFHKGNIYAYHQDTIYTASISNPTFQNISLPNVSGIYSLFFVEDTMYVCAQEYDDGDTIHFYAVLACTLQGEIKELIHENDITYYIDNDVMFYLNTKENHTYMLIRNEDKHLKLLDGACAYFFSFHDQYVIDSVTFDDARLLVVDKQGTILKNYTYPDDEFHYPQVFTGDKLYIWKNQWFGYYDLTKDELLYQELKEGI